MADRVREARARDRLPLVIGGDCTIELGTVAGFADEPTAPGLLYDDHGEVIARKTGNNFLSTGGRPPCP